MILNIIEIGELAYFEDYPMLVTFNDTAPLGLREICIITDYKNNTHDFKICEGQKIRFSDEIYTVRKVGHLANHTLSDLGHATFYFKEINELPPGAILLSPNKVPKLEEMDKIHFYYE